MEKIKKKLILFLCIILPCLSNCSSTKLFNAIDKNDLNLVKKYLNDSNINDFNSKGKTPLMESAINNNYEIADFFIKSGADVNKQSIKLNDEKHLKPSPIFNQTTLMFACKSGNLKIVELLINNKAEINIMDSLGETALFYLCRNTDDNVEILKLLIKNKADINIKGAYYKVAPIDLAKSFNNKKIFNHLKTTGEKIGN
jgi:ankyrin repeat protein